MLTLDDMHWLTHRTLADKIKVPADDYRALKNEARTKLQSGAYMLTDADLARKGLAINGIEIVPAGRR